MRRFLLFLGLFCLAAVPAGAADVEYWEAWTAGGSALRPASTSSQWRGNFGVGLGFAPDYPGSKDYELVGLPMVDIEWRDTVFFGTQRGLGAYFFTTRQFRAGARLTYDRGRDNGANERLRSLPDVDPSVEAGVFAEYYRRAWRFTADARKGMTDGHEGVILSGSAAVGGRLSERGSLIVGAELHVADSDYMDAYFGVGAISAASGLLDFGFFMHVIYSLSERLYITLDPRISVLQGDAATSALTNDDVQYFLGTLVGYRF